MVYLPGRLAPSRAALVDALVRSRRGQVINASPVGAPVAGRILTTTDIDEEVRTVVSLILADLGARSVVVGELPVGIITGALGGPFFLVLLRRSLRA